MFHRLFLTPPPTAPEIRFSGAGSLYRVNFPGGYVSGGVEYHYIHDHQGNVRQVVNATTGKVDQENHYYSGGCFCLFFTI